MGPACITKMDRVGVIWILVTFAAVPVPSCPIHLYVTPFTLILPDHPMIACAFRSSNCRPVQSWIEDSPVDSRIVAKNLREARSP